MADEGRHDFAKSRIRRARELAQDCFCHVGLIFDDHLSSSAPFRLAAVYWRGLYVIGLIGAMSPALCGPARVT
jgi:hypothetical protein